MVGERRLDRKAIGTDGNPSTQDSAVSEVVNDGAVAWGLEMTAGSVPQEGWDGAVAWGLEMTAGSVPQEGWRGIRGGQEVDALCLIRCSMAMR